MLKNKIDVMLWGEPVGKLYWDNISKRAIFNYDRSFIEKGIDISPLKQSIKGPAGKGLPIAGNRDDLYKGLPEFIADSLPDKWGNKVFDHWASKNKIPRSQLNSIDMLSFIGKRAMGALEYEPDVKGMTSEKDIRIDELYQLAKEMFETRSQILIDPKQDLALQALYEIGTSAGGMHPKAIIAINEKTGDIKSGQITLDKDYKYYILKFAENDGYPYTQIEKTYYDMAKMAKIDMMPSKLLEVGGVNHFLTERYDRQKGEKIHVLTLAAINPGVVSYEGLFDTAFELNVPEQEIKQLFRRMVFNVMGANVDDHIKNFSFMMEKNGLWHITPAYDLMFTVQIGGMAYNNCHSMSICGKKDNIELEDLVNFANSYGIKNTNRTIEEVATAICNFRAFATNNGVEEYWIDKIEEYLQELVPEKYRERMNGYMPTTVEPYITKEGFCVQQFSLSETEKHDFRVEAKIDDKIYKFIVGRKKELAKEIISQGINKMEVEKKKELIRNLLLPMVYRNKGMKLITDISIYPDQSGTSLFIRCKADGVQLMHERLSSGDKKRYEEIKLSGNKADMTNLKEELAEKYFKEQLENERKCTLKR